MYKTEYRDNLIIGEKFAIRKYFIIRIKRPGKITIGNNVFFNNFCSLNCIHSIEIGDDCIFGEGVKIYDHNHCYQIESVPISKQGYKAKKVKLGSNCWIGSNVVILPGVTIGDNSVIGAGTIVYRDIPPNFIVKNTQIQEGAQIERISQYGWYPQNFHNHSYI